MEYKQTTIAPAGRNKYGNYISSTNVTKSVATTIYAGNDSTTTIGGSEDNPESQTPDFFCMLSQTNATFTGLDLAQGASSSTVVIAYKGYDKGATYVCDFESVTAVTESDGSISDVISPKWMGMVDVPAGITPIIQNNGTSATTITFAADSLLTGNTGSILIPVNVYKRSDNIPEPDDLYNWYEHKDDCQVVWLEWVWNVNRAAVANYTLDLSNQMAGVNCDSAGTLYSNSIATLQCTATTYYNGEIADGITYSASTQAAYAAHGYRINANTGVMSFTSAGTNQFYWAPAYPSLPIDIIAIKDGEPIATKTMTINRNYPGTDGTPAHTRYILTNADFIVYDPNTSTFTPTQVTGQVWLQVGNELPVKDNSTTIYQWFDDLEQYKTSAQGSITANATIGINSISFALKNGDGDYYEIEDVPVISKGKDGEPGNPGDPGASGESAWYLTLSNDNASINCDSEGNILPNAVRPTCQAKLYHGNTIQTNAAYVVDYGGASGVTSGVSDGILTLSFGSTFNFTGGTLSITISGYSGDIAELKDVKIMNVTKAIAGEGGEDAITYWLEPDYGEIIYNPNNKSVSPSSIAVNKYKQVGQQAVSPAGDATIKYRWQSRSTGAFTNETTYTSSISVSSGQCETYSRLRFTLYVGNSQVDQEDIDILREGVDAEVGGQGRTGAAIRGPYLWDNVTGSTRCWCAGETGSTCSDCDKWIDVILKDGTYYYCNTTYNGRVYPWNSYSQYWTSGDTFDFVAANLILASGASIDFLTNNELYLKDSNGNITAGAAGGDGINFWAGSDSPGDAPFTVSNDGTMVATQGTFGPFTIGTDTAGNSALKGSSSADTSDTLEKHEMYLNPDNIHFVGTVSSSTYTHTETISIVPSRDPDRYDGNGAIEIAIADKVATDCGNMEKEFSDSTAFYTNGTMVAHAYKGEGRTRGIGGFGQAVMSPLKGIEITFMTTASTNFAKYGTWFINGVDTTISAAEPQSLFTKTSYSGYDVWYFDGKPLNSFGVCIPYSSTYNFTTGGTQTWHFNGNDLGFATTDYSRVGTRTSSSTFGTASDIGYWMVYNTSGAALNTGIANPNYITKRNNVIYIEV